LAELVAAGCGDWDQLEAGWTLHRVRAVQAHWRNVAPPAHVSLAALAGFRRKERVDDPADLAQRLRDMGLLT
jgi:hypothetical protein